jgi:HAE1 family hydrophobic/amphiphilic exporter-1
MSSLARLSLRNRGLTALVAVLVVGLGIIAIPQLKQQLFPSLDFPAAFISASLPGAAPDIVDRQVTQPVTSAIQGVPGLKTTTATSREGAATVQVEFEFGTDLDRAVSKLETSLNQVQAQLPQGVNPSVFAGSTSDFPVVVLAASADGDEKAVADRLRSAVLPEIKKIPGVREATVTGARDETLVITPDPVRLATAGVDTSAIGAALKGNGVATPTGAVAQGDKSLTVQVGTPFNSIDDLRNLYVSPGAGVLGGGGAAGKPPVRLGDIATVSEELAPATSITRTNGKPSLGVSVTATPDGNAVRISDQVRDDLPKLRTALGAGAQLTPVFDQAPFVKKSIRGLAREGGLGLLFAVLVILIFLLSVRSTLVTAVSIPLSVVIALIALWAGDYSLNVLTLGALTIAVGRVVDDSIVVLENIKRHLEYGEDKLHAVVTAVREVAGAVTASTITTVAVFSPIALVGGLVGQLFSSFAITITVALLASLLVSLTVIPVLAYWFLRPSRAGGTPDEIRRRADEKERRSLLQRAYLPVIRFATRRRLVTLMVGILVFFATIGLATGLKTNFFDRSGDSSLTISQKMPIGTGLGATNAATQQVEKVLADTDDIASYQVTTGGGGGFGGGGASPNEATFSVTVEEGKDAATVQDRLRDRLAGLSGAGELKVAAGGGGGGGFSADQLAVIVEAKDADTLARATESIRQTMAGTAGVSEVGSDLSTTVPRIEVALRRDAAGRYGLTDTTVSQVVGAALRGSQLGQVTVAGSPEQAILRFSQSPTDLGQLERLTVPTATGPVALGQIADVRTVNGPVQVSRIDGDRSATVTGTATGSNVGKITQDLTNRLKKASLPAGASYRLGGVSSDQSDAFADLGLALLAAIAIVYIVMAATFGSLVQPLILLVSIPFAATGAIGMLLATGTALGVPALIGMLMLIGIVVTNAIVLLDLINHYRRAGMDVQEAVVEGGRHRLRPILMTAIATIFALLPMASGIERSGGFISQPLAVVVIGGLISSTLLTLVLVPTLYTMVENRAERRRQRRARRGGRHEVNATPDGSAPTAEPTTSDPEPAHTH